MRASVIAPLVDPPPRLPTCRSGDARLVQRACRGSRLAFGVLWSRHAARILALLRRMVGPDQSDDVAQEVAVTALRNLYTLREPERFGAWLRTIARNAARDALTQRRRAAAQPLDDDIAAMLCAPPSGDPIITAEILATIEELPACHRTVLRLRLADGLTGTEIAGRLNMTDGSVRVNLCKGTRLLRCRLQRAKAR